MSWTEERVELLRKLWAEGHSASQIANEIANGVTRNAVIGKVHRLGLAGRVKSPSAGQQRNRGNERSVHGTAMATAAGLIATGAVSTGGSMSGGSMSGGSMSGGSMSGPAMAGAPSAATAGSVRIAGTATQRTQSTGATMAGVAGGGANGSRPAAPMMRGNVAYALAPEMEQAVEAKIQNEAVVLPMSERVTIMELRESMCRWPLGDPTSPDFRYCGAEAPIGAGPYCAFHSSVAYQPVQDRRRDRAKIPGH